MGLTLVGDVQQPIGDFELARIVERAMGRGVSEAPAPSQSPAQAPWNSVHTVAPAGGAPPQRTLHLRTLPPRSIDVLPPASSGATSGDSILHPSQESARLGS